MLRIKSFFPVGMSGIVMAMGLPAMAAEEPGLVESQLQEINTAWKEDRLFRGFTRLKYTTVYLDPIEKQVSDTGSEGLSVADIETDDIYTVSVGVVLFPKTKHIELTYTTALQGGAEEFTGTSSQTKSEGVEQLSASFRPFERFELSYDKYKLNSYMTVKPGETVLLVDPDNLSTASGGASGTDLGVNLLTGGDVASLSVERERFEGRYYAAETTWFGAPFYTALFYEEFKKPWGSAFEVWSESADVTKKVAAVYSQSVFESVGLAVGAQKDYVDLQEGFNLRSASFSMSLLDIQLTDNYSLSDRMENQEGQKAIKLAFAGEVAYKKQFTPRAEGVASFFVAYDLHYIDMGHTNTNLNTSGDYSNYLKGDHLLLSSDVTYGASVSLMF